ncbi:hypothetical protein [Glutamicibacter sp. MCAF14]|uniref:hypothetical protein n=1 Tax=Glutamicibacter sp. MCAF14 TaxID=3233043 RepID=UPI003F8E8F91
MEEKEPQVPFAVHLTDGRSLHGAPAPLGDVVSFYDYIADETGKLKFPATDGRMILVAAKRINYISFELPKEA